MKGSMGTVLRMITQYLEARPNGKLLVNCSAGKDRTGMVCCLVQRVAGYSDQEIVREYIISDALAKPYALRYFQRHPSPLADPEVLSGADEAGILGALSYVRETYGSVDCCLDHIGFDSEWRSRLKHALQVD
mmetsp:Transcript_33681/g.96725  ORF Transcript_33681/g.96725 Transcript_33681/m.96725 type:complete len:132 (-) Transcript_33681:94-489(-)